MYSLMTAHELQTEIQRINRLELDNAPRKKNLKLLPPYQHSDRDMRQQLEKRSSGRKSASDKEKWESFPGGLESLENVSMYTSQQNLGELTEEAMTEVYSKYSFQTKEETTKLAINEYKQQILDRINYQPVVIIEGPTGCGKTTQVPQWILDDCYQKRKHCKIIVTQPRRIAAISIAKRVAQERGWDVGGLVGYQVGLENKTSTDSRITYATTGILLQKLVASKTMNEYTHIILDEVHERGQEMDFLLLVVRRLLYTVSQKVKVILMSATFNYAEFADYFQQPTISGPEPSTCIRIIKKQPMFNVKTFYLNHLYQFGTLVQSAMRGNDQPSILPDMNKLVIKLVNAFEFIDKQEESYSDASQADLPSVLIFLPGINEIEDLYSMLTSLGMRSKVAGPECANYKWCVLPLHSTITADEQVRVFQRAPPGTRKIILSTNIAESSITVPDVKYVVDFCLMKILVADEQTNFTSLQLHWASRNNCEQRAGRAGRVREGRVYRLVTDKFYESLSQECPPEICRCPLERLVLLAKMLNMGPPADILGLAMNPPDLSNIHRTVLVLKEIGAMQKTLEGEHSDIDGDITYLGRIMAKLPLDVRVSKLIMLGHIYGCLNETVIMAAAMSVKNIFNNPFMERLHAYNSKLTWANGSTSDCIAFLNVYRVWTHLRQQQFFKQRGNNVGAWAQRFYVQARALRELDELVRELHCRLSREGIEQLKAGAPWNKNTQTLLLKILLAGAFYPHYFVMSGKADLERNAVKTLGGLDPRTTVFLTDFPMGQPGSVYASSIKKLVHEMTGDEPRVTFDSNSAKVYLSFKDAQASDGLKKESEGNPTIPGNVVLPVYKAIKMRQLSKGGAGRSQPGLGPGIRLALLPPEKAQELALELEASKLDINKNMMVPRLPELDDTHFPLRISQFVNCGRFYVQHDDEATFEELRGLNAELNARPLLAHTAAAAPGELLAAPYRDEGGTRMYRVKLMKALPQDMVWVSYIDYGGFARVNAGSLRSLPLGLCRDLPPMAMECVLAKVAPSPLLDAHGQWTKDATNYFQKLIQKGPLIGKVYSVVKGVVAIKLLADNGLLNVNKELIAKKYAHAFEESYESMANHLLRKTASELDRAQKRAFNSEQVELAYQDLREPAPPSAEQCVAEVQLKGPYSPLETSLHSLMEAGGKKVSIEWNSVNSVLLYTEPQEIYQRLLVAGAVGTNEDSGQLSLRHTTLMPNIPGLPAIMALLFCPTTELRRDSTATRYVSALCGLGATEDGAPLFPEHDLLVYIDVDFSIDDIILINHIRHLMDYMMYTGPGQDTPSADDAARAKVPAIIYDNLMELLTRSRSLRPEEAVARAWRWGSAPAAELLELTEPGLQERAVAYPLHAPLELRAPTEHTLRALKRDHDDLVHTVRRMPGSSTQEVECTLCSTGSMSLLAMRTHLASRSHREKKEIFRMLET